MKKTIIVSMIMVIILLAWSFLATAQPQDSANEEKPTFYRLVPGTYVNGWPRFIKKGTLVLKQFDRWDKKE
jgi:hypothetical protein